VYPLYDYVPILSVSMINSCQNGGSVSYLIIIAASTADPSTICVIF